MSETDKEISASSEAAATPKAPDRWILLLCGLAAVLMASQAKLPMVGGRISFADIAVGIALAATFLYLWRSRSRLRLPVSVVVAVAGYCLANIAARSGLGGAVESAQRIEQLFCGLIVLAFLQEYKPSWVPRAIGIGLALNLLIALVQVGKHGFGSSLAPADVLALKYGFGHALTGLFRSRMGLSFYLALALVWCQPYWLSRCRGWSGRVLVLAGTIVVLCFVAHGQMLVIVGGVLILVGFLHSRAAAVVNITAVCLVALSLGTSEDGVRAQTVSATLSPVTEGRFEQGYYEVVAALRMAADNPWAGVGSGRYQDFIGTYYRELPNPNRNDIETDTQCGLGILFGTVGFPAGALLLVLLVGGLSRALRRFAEGGSQEPLYLASAGIACVLLGGMFVSDPFVRGLGWFPALMLAGAFHVPAGDTGTYPAVRAFGSRGLLSVGVGFGVLLLLLVAVSGEFRRGASRQSATPAAAVQQTPAAATGTAAAPAVSIPSGPGLDFFVVLNAADAKEVTAPAVSAKDSHVAKGVILRIPDKTKVPPDGEADLKYGGAVFEIEVARPVECVVWVRTWWEGSCGNSVYLKAGKDDTLSVVGNDGTYDAWHWLKAPQAYTFEAGKQRIAVLNREDGVRVHQILVTNDAQYVPQGEEE